MMSFLIQLAKDREKVMNVAPLGQCRWNGADLSESRETPENCRHCPTKSLCRQCEKFSVGLPLMV